MCGTKLSLLARNGPIWRFFCMQGEFYTVLATKKPSRESFVPNARQRSSEPTQQHTRPHRHGAEDTRGAAGPGRGAGCGRLVGPARVRRATARQISHAIRLGQISTNPENVAIPTMQIQCLNKLRGKCMRNYRGAVRFQRHTATRPRRCGGCGKGWWARLRCPWAVAGPGRASRRRAERSSQRGRLAGGPPPTGTPRSPAHAARHTQRTQQGARSAVAPRAPASTASAHRLSWMLRPGTASISSRV